MVCAHHGEDSQCLKPRKADIAKWWTLTGHILPHYDRCSDLNAARSTISHSFERFNSSSVLCSLLNPSFAFFSCVDQQPQRLNYISASLIHTHTLLIYTALICIIEIIIMRKWFDSIGLDCLAWFYYCLLKEKFVVVYCHGTFFHSTDSTYDEQSMLTSGYKCRESELLL